jgi:hypothetical protein
LKDRRERIAWKTDVPVDESAFVIEALPPRPVEDQKHAARLDAMYGFGPVWYFEVEYGSKDEAKRLGATWFPDIQLWGTHDPAAAKRLAQIFRSANLEPLNFIGEDRTFGGSQLYVDLIPIKARKVNARSMLPKGEWDMLRRYVYRRANNCCEACGAPKSPENWLEAHERWDYIEDGRGGGCQKLIRLVALCFWCHAATHMDYSICKRRRTRALKHLAKVKKISLAAAKRLSQDAHVLRYQRDSISWKTDVSVAASAFLREPGFPPPGAAPVAAPVVDQKQAARPDALHSNLYHWIRQTVRRMFDYVKLW